MIRGQNIVEPIKASDPDLFNIPLYMKLHSSKSTLRANLKKIVCGSNFVFYL